MMDFQTYLALVDECKNYSSAEMLLAEYGYPPNCKLSADELVRAFNIIWAVSEANVRRLAELSCTKGYTTFCRKYGIPVRTGQRWIGADRNPPEYVVRLLGFAILSEEGEFYEEKRAST